MQQAKLIEWNSSYELGIEDIDFQHRYFLNLINRLAFELSQTENSEYRCALIAELNAYARFHFISEENIMQREGYPQLPEHKGHHLKLIDDLSHRQAALTVRQTETEAEAILDFLAEWFLNHTVIEDRQFANFVMQKQPAASS